MASEGQFLQGFEASGKELKLHYKDNGEPKILSRGMSREDFPLERSLWRTEGRAEGQGEAGGSVNSLQLSW